MHILLKHYLDSGLSKSAIAKQLGISRRLVYHLVKTGQVEREVDVDTPRERVLTRVGKLRWSSR